jgi:hypothetical protein
MNVLDLLLANVPLVAGVLIGQAAAAYRLTAIHNAVLRSATLESARPANLRARFAGIVNGRRGLLDRRGQERPVWWASLAFYRDALALLLALLALPLSLAVLGLAALAAAGVELRLPDSLAAERTARHLLYACQAGIGVSLYVLCSWGLRRPEHRTYLVPRTELEREGAPRQVLLVTAQRDPEDGLAACDVRRELVDAGRADNLHPNPLRVLVNILRNA